MGDVGVGEAEAPVKVLIKALMEKRALPCPEERAERERERG